MTRQLTTFRFRTLTVAILMLSLSVSASRGAEPMVFISSFEPDEQGAIDAFSFDLKSGSLQPVHRTTGIEHPFFLALAPSGKYLYSIHAKNFGGKEEEQVAAFELVGRTGQLKLLNRQSAKGTAACYLQVDATGKTVVVANYSTGSVAALPVNADGSLGPAASFIQHVGSSVDKSRQEGPHAHCIVVSPDNQFVYSADLGLDQILSYRLNATNAKLTANAQPFARTPPGAGPRHLTFHPDGKRIYVINELSNSITHYDYDKSTGILIERHTISTVPEKFVGTSHCADLKITPDGKYLFGTNRGHDSIAAYRIADDGRLSLIAIEPSLGKGPQNLAITSNGAYLICANMPGKNVAVFRIDALTGSLKSVGAPIEIPSPSCIQLLP